MQVCKSLCNLMMLSIPYEPIDLQHYLLVWITIAEITGVDDHPSEIYLANILFDFTPVYYFVLGALEELVEYEKDVALTLDSYSYVKGTLVLILVFWAQGGLYAE